MIAYTYFYPRPPRGGRHEPTAANLYRVHISIHALREEGDNGSNSKQPGSKPISIHALREEGDRKRQRKTGYFMQFLSTPSARRATEAAVVDLDEKQISIHALREEGDVLGYDIHQFYMEFLSTPSARRATRRWPPSCSRPAYFYPRPPRGGRRCSSPSTRTSSNYFYPRPPRGGRLPAVQRPRCVRTISIHALREEGDETPSLSQAWMKISIHALREEGDFWPIRRFQNLRYFYPRPPRGGRQQKQRQNLYFLINYTTFCTNLEEP